MSLQVFTEQLGYNNAPFHLEWYDRLENEFSPLKIHPNRKKLLLQFWPRGHGKTSCNINYLSWLIGNYPDIHINLVSKTAAQAESILLALMTRFESDEKYIDIFGELKPKQPKKWTTQELIVNRTEISKNPTIQACGLIGPITGRRADLNVCDDIIDEENVRSPLQLEKALTWHDKVLAPTLYPWGGEIVTGTRWHYADLYAEFIKRKPQAVDIKKAILNEQAQQVLWPEYWSYPKLVEKRGEVGSVIFECLVKGSPIFTANGYKPIEQLRIGDTVMTHKANWQQVEQTHNEETKEPIHSITVYGDPEPLQVTASHKIWSFKSRKYKSKHLAPHHTNISAFTKDWIEKAVNWHKAEDLEKQDFIITPIDRTAQVFYSVDPEFWWFVGLYLADGCINYSNNRIEIALNQTTDEAIKNRLLSHLEKKQIKCSVYQKTALTVSFSNKPLCAFLKTLGRYSYGKYLTKEIMQLPTDLQTALWEGFVDGDGYQDSNIIQVTSNNLNLLRQFKQILLRCNIVSSVALTVHAKTRMIQNRTIQQKNQYLIRIRLSPKRHRVLEIYGNCLFSRIKKVTVENKPQTVYNLQISQDHSYTTAQGAVANCQYQNDPTSMEGSLLKAKWLVPWEQRPPAHCQYYFGIDPSLGEADFFGVAILAYDQQTGQGYLEDVFAEHLPFPQMIKEKLPQLVRAYKPLKIFMETNFWQKLLTKIPELNTLPIVPVNTVKNKEERFIPLSSHFESKRVLVNPLLLNKGEFWTQWVQFPRGQHDDAIDCVELVVSKIVGSGPKASISFLR